MEREIEREREGTLIERQLLTDGTMNGARATNIRHRTALVVARAKTPPPPAAALSFYLFLKIFFSSPCLFVRSVLVDVVASA